MFPTRTWEDLGMNETRLPVRGRHRDRRPGRLLARRWLARLRVGRGRISRGVPRPADGRHPAHAGAGDDDRLAHVHRRPRHARNRRGRVLRPARRRQADQRARRDGDRLRVSGAGHEMDGRQPSRDQARRPQRCRDRDADAGLELVARRRLRGDPLLRRGGAHVSRQRRRSRHRRRAAKTASTSSIRFASPRRRASADGSAIARDAAPEADRDARIHQQFGKSCHFERACAGLWGIDCDSAADGPYYYADAKTLAVVTTCGGACMGGHCTDCPPEAVDVRDVC